MRELPHPPEAESDEDSIEMIRGWIINGELQVSLSAWVWEDEPKQWGRLLADTVAHLSDAIAEQTGNSRDDIYDQISNCLQHYLQNQRELEGEFVEPRPNA